MKKPTEFMWGILELMGHVKLAGRISEEQKFGTVLGRIDIPHGRKFITQYFSGGSIYRVTPCTEDVARAFAKGREPQPIEPWEIPQLNARHYDENGDTPF